MVDKIQQRSAAYEKSLDLIQKLKVEPEYCECARIGSRALADGKMPVLRYLTKVTDYFDRNNLQLEHQHIIFDQSKDNIGLTGEEGIAELFQEEPSAQTYHYSTKECLDGSAMRQAIEMTGIPKVYAWLGFNCQAYAQSVKQRYQQVKDSIAQNMCSIIE